MYLMLYSVRRELTGGSHWSEMVASCEETKFMFFDPMFTSSIINLFTWTARMLRLRAGFGKTAV